MASQFERYTEKGETSSTDLAINYWTLTPYKLSNVRYVGSMGNNYNNIPINTNGVKPSINLKSNVIITSGTGTKSDPFVLTLWVVSK